MKNNNQMRILLLMEYMKKYTDEQYPATVSMITDYLKSKGITATRKTIYSDIEVLLSFGLDIVVQRSTQNKYFVGNHLFQLPELKMLADAATASRVISSKKTAELINKLCQLTNTTHADEIRRLTTLVNRIKPENESIYYLIDRLQSAMLEKKQVTFQYYEYTPQKKKVLKHSGEHYRVDPYGLEWKNDRYYLVGYSYKHQRIAHFRVDRLVDVQLAEESFILPPKFNMVEYVNQIIDMYADTDPVSITLRCANDLMRVIVDNYGEGVQTKAICEGQFIAVIKAVPSPTFYSWVFQFCGRIQIEAPKQCVEEMNHMARRYLTENI